MIKEIELREFERMEKETIEEFNVTSSSNLNDKHKGNMNQLQNDSTTTIEQEVIHFNMINTYNKDRVD